MSDQQLNNQQDANDLPSVSIRRPVLIVVLNVLIAIAGLAALMGVEVRELPDVDRPVVGVSATLPGGAPETVDAEVTSILEGAAARVSGWSRYSLRVKKTAHVFLSNSAPELI